MHQIFVMIYLTDTTRENGCLKYLSGSHRKQHKFHDSKNAHSEELARVENPDDPLFNNEENKATAFNILAVSPIETVSDDKSQINLAVGLTQDLSGGLKKAAKSLNVVTLNEKPESISDLASNIGARYIISGSLRQAGETIRISVKLTDTVSLSEVWNENYDRKYTASNIFSIQDEIVNNIVDELVGNGAILAQEVAKSFSNTGTSNMSAFCLNNQYF